MKRSNALVNSSRTFHWFWLTLGFTVYLGMCACSDPTKLPEVGKWQGVESEILEFRRDGTLRGLDRYGRPLTGTYQLVGADRVRIKTQVTYVDRKAGTKMTDNVEGVCRLEVKDGSLAIIEENGARTHYKRVK